jgi:uncharacterized protein (DUF1810 family)
LELSRTGDRHGQREGARGILVSVSDPFRLRRFVEAQDQADHLNHALEELRQGRKRTHWMWFVFPQIAGLGTSPMAQHFAISGLPEAQAYLSHPVLGPRLGACAGTLTELDQSDPEAVFGPVDAVKLRSSMTLFARAAAEEGVFSQVLAQYFDGDEDELTIRLLAG